MLASMVSASLVAYAAICAVAVFKRAVAPRQGLNGAVQPS